MRRKQPTDSVPPPQVPRSALDHGFDVFRESFLLRVTDPAFNRALRAGGAVVHEMALEFNQYWPHRPGSLAYWDLHALLGDLRYVQYFLAEVASYPEAMVLRRVEVPLCEAAGREAKALAEITDRLERTLASHDGLSRELSDRDDEDEEDGEEDQDDDRDEKSEEPVS